MNRSTLRRVTAPTVLLGAALLAAGCASSSVGGDQRPASVQNITIHATDRLRFSPSTVTVHPGTVRIRLVDDGSYPHNFSLPARHATSHTVTGNLGERSTTLTLHISQLGTYQFVCVYHDSAGMRGRLVVK